MKTVIALRGIPGSGKSTWATNAVKNLGISVARINNDDLVKMLWGGMQPRNQEASAMLHEARLNLLRFLLTQPHVETVIIDNTNLNKSTVRSLENLSNELGAWFTVKDDFLAVDVEECIKRDALRPAPVGEKVIRDMAKQANRLQPWTGNVTPIVEPYNNKQKLPSVILCDIDGTVALMNGRGPYEFDKVHTDIPNKPVRDLIDNLVLESLSRIIFMSGRGEECRTETEAWLLDNTGLWEIELYMRPAGDRRPDWIVKYELFQQHIAGKYVVDFVLDDRDQVVHLWRNRLGLPTFQVANGNF